MPHGDSFTLFLLAVEEATLRHGAPVSAGKKKGCRGTREHSSGARRLPASLESGNGQVCPKGDGWAEAQQRERKRTQGVRGSKCGSLLKDDLLLQDLGIFWSPPRGLTFQQSQLSSVPLVSPHTLRLPLMGCRCLMWSEARFRCICPLAFRRTHLQIFIFA